MRSSNLVEAPLSWLSDVRRWPAFNFIKFFMWKVMKRNSELKLAASKWNSPLTPWADAKYPGKLKVVRVRVRLSTREI